MRDILFTMGITTLSESVPQTKTARAAATDTRSRRGNATKAEALFEFLVVLIHQRLPVGFGKRIVAQQEARFLSTWALLLYPAFIALYVAHYYVNDQLKTPLELYFKYRFGVAAILVALCAVSLIFRNRNFVIKACFLAMATLLSVVQAWSMTLGPVVTIKWIVWLPALVFAVTSSSFVFSIAWLGTLVFVTQPYWSGKELVTRALFSDFIVATVLLLFTQVARRVWVVAGINYHMFELATEELREQERTFYKEIRKFIAPVFVQRIEAKRQKGQSPIEPIDEVLKRTRKDVAVLYTDLRDFSLRSDDQEFVEKEMIPSATSIIDDAEKNLGIAKQIGDAVLVYYDQDDQEVSLLRAIRDGLRGSRLETIRVLGLGRSKPERHFSVTIGTATVGNMASSQHYEPTVIGRPTNLAARIDSLTRHPAIVSRLQSLTKPAILLSRAAGEMLQTFSKQMVVERVDLASMSIEMKSFPQERQIYLFVADENNMDLMNRIFIINGVERLQMEDL